MTDLAIPPLPRQAQTSPRAAYYAPRKSVPDFAELDAIPCLPGLFVRLAQHQLRDPRTTSDHLLLMADGLAEASEAAALDGLLALREALRTLASVLRGMAPLYGGVSQ